MKHTPFLLLGMALLAGPVQAQDFQNRQIRLISPFAPGGGSDFLGRFLAGKLGAALSRTVIVENRAGAGGMVGTEHVAKAPPDGHTILIGSNGPLAVFPALYAKLPYDTGRDFQPISLLTKQPFVILLNTSVPAKDLRELIEYAKSHPGQVNFGTPGSGSAPHLAIEMLALQAGVKLTHVPYKGGPPALTDLVAGQIQMATADPNTATPLLKQGRIRALAVTTSTRSSAMPDVATVAESGLAGYEVSGWFGALVPAGTPRPLVDRLGGVIAKAMTSPEAKEALGGFGGELHATTPAEFDRFIKSEAAKWANVIKTLNIKPES